MGSTRMPFGKYKGWPLGDIPHDYLLWVIDNVTNLKPHLRQAIMSELAPPQRSEGPLVPWGDVIRRWYRELTLRFHPDRGGSHEAMVALNTAKDHLERLVGGGR